MAIYEVWFTSSSSARTQVAANTRGEAIRLFADLHNIKPSSYISCRKLKVK